MATGEDRQPVQALGPDRSDPSLAEGCGVRKIGSCPMSWRSRDCEIRGTAVWREMMIVYGSLQDETNLENWRSQKPRRRSATHGQHSTNVPGRSWKRTTLVPSTGFLPSALCKRRLGTGCLGKSRFPATRSGFRHPPVSKLTRSVGRGRRKPTRPARLAWAL